MVDAKILGSEWVQDNPEGGFELKPGAPEDIKKEFEIFQNALAATAASACEAAAAIEKELDEKNSLGGSP
ncbi:MAG: hypothetical protein FWG94_08035 [Oscillospiraceae bacterium]|nr:hypothetical protein [Oscillospiraceae bacterium]